MSTKPAVRTMALVMVILVVANLAFASTALDSEQTARMRGLAIKAQNNTLAVGDMHEAAEHQRIAAARLRDGGNEGNVDAYLRSTANTTKLINRCLQSNNATITSCQKALGYLRTYGSHDTLLAAAFVAHEAYKWGSFTPTGYYGGAHLLPVGFLANCGGVREAIDVSIIAGSAMLLFPAAQGAGGVTLLFGAVLTFAADYYC